jgi:hypothetical protein
MLQDIFEKKLNGEIADALQVFELIKKNIQFVSKRVIASY